MSEEQYTNPADFTSGLHFDLPKNRSSVIKVIGVGGGGSNAVNYMKMSGINGVDFIVCNTDSQALEFSPVETKIQLGVNLTEGLGAGANPEVGERAALESLEDVRSILGNQTKMLFVTAGMGGGTGTGAAPIIAKIAQEMGILTVGIVTLPFAFEGSIRARQAELGIEKLRAHVDSLIVVNNNKLREVYGNLGFKAGFTKADEVLATAARGIAEVITHHYRTNIDLRDARTVLASSGTALMGSFQAGGSNRAIDAITGALDSPLLNDNHIHGAKNVLLLIVSGSNEHEITFDEIGEINDHIQREAGGNANIIMGIGEDSSLGQAVQVTVVATGFAANAISAGLAPKEEPKVIFPLDGLLSTDTAPRTANGHLIQQDLFGATYAPMPEELKETPSDLTPKGETEDDFIFLDVPSLDVSVLEEAEEPTAELEEFESPFELSMEVAFTLDKSAPATVIEWDLPLSSVAAVELDSPLPEETAPIASFSPVEEVRVHTLDDLLALERDLGLRAPVSPKSVVDPHLHFEVQTKPAERHRDTMEASTLVDPLEQRIEDAMENMAMERRNYLRSFNHTFKNRQKDWAADTESVPAFQRQGVPIAPANYSQQNPLGQTGLSGEGATIEFRQHNSFLHDNVD